MKTIHKLFPISFFVLLIMAFHSSVNCSELVQYFPEIPGFTRKDEPAVYNPDNLYNTINGAADVYLNFEFRELATLTYEKGEDQSLIIEIYSHKDLNCGFGIYSHERVYGVSNYVDVGTQGYYETGILNFFKDGYYVKIRAYDLENEEQTLIDIAKTIAAELPGDNHFPEALQDLPYMYRTFNREQYIPKNFLGYSFINKTFTADYYNPNIPTGAYSFFISLCGSKEECKKLLFEYRKFLELPEEEIVEGRHTFDDPYYGTVSLLWEGTRIKGIYGVSDEEYISEQFAFDRNDYILKIDESNVSYQKSVTSSSDENFRLKPEYAVDGDLTTRWSSAWSDPQWIRIDLGDEYNINKIKLYWEGAYGRSYNILVSLDGNAWKEVYATITGDGGEDDLSIEPVNARYLKLNGLERATQYGYSLYEILVFQTGN